MSNNEPSVSSDRLLGHPPLFQTFPTSLAVHIAPVDMRSTESQMRTFREFASKGDPLADALISEFQSLPEGVGRRNFEIALEHGIAAVQDPTPALTAFFANVDKIPDWVDLEKLRLGAASIRRTGLPGAFGGLIDVSLMGGYLSYRALKVLVRTGEISKMAPRRVTETALWWLEVTEDGGWARSAAGFKDTMRVRLTHAHIRAAMSRREDWNSAEWDAPINQPQMAGTLLLFSLVSILGLRVMGFRFSSKEIDSIIHLWRYIGFLCGVHQDLIPKNEAEAWKTLWLVASTEFKPDEDSRTLAVALSQALPSLHGITGDDMASRMASWAVIGYHSAISRLVLGNVNCDALGLPNKPIFSLLAVAASLSTFALETVRTILPGATALSLKIGESTRRAAVGALVSRLRPNRTFTREQQIPKAS